jgi:hypothetical protein
LSRRRQSSAMPKPNVLGRAKTVGERTKRIPLPPAKFLIATSCGTAARKEGRGCAGSQGD